jgi:hypothetical protein
MSLLLSPTVRRDRLSECDMAAIAAEMGGPLATWT